ncbi:MAG: hypothetical protein JWO75_3578 [Actinomycetia bacterium]|nr:hypothetical protein [Actinomycetes bacterium]
MWRAYAPGGGGAVEPRTTTLPEEHRLGFRLGSATRAISSSAARVPTS